MACWIEELSVGYTEALQPMFTIPYYGGPFQENPQHEKVWMMRQVLSLLIIATIIVDYYNGIRQRSYSQQRDTSHKCTIEDAKFCLRGTKIAPFS